MSFETPGGGKPANARLVELEAEERYARERYQLYKAKAYGSRLTSAARLRELERNSVLAKRRLDRSSAAAQIARKRLPEPKPNPKGTHAEDDYAGPSSCSSGGPRRA